MKKWMAILLTLAICLGLAACGEEPVATTEPTEPPTAREQLSAEEERLFSALITVTTEDFFEPSAVRVLEVCDYSNTASRPELITVRLQGENRVGGTVNHYYRVCLTGQEEFSEDMQDQMLIWSFDWLFNGDTYAHLKHMEYKAETGEYEIYGDNYTTEKEAKEFDVKKINRALKEYWDEMGF